MASIHTLLVLAFALLAPVLALDNGLSRTPTLGWNSYNAFNVDTTEEQYRQQADALVSTGLAAAGYRYINM